MNYIDDIRDNIDENTVIIKLFGEVCLKQGEKIIKCDEVRSEMLTKLLSYIVINHKRVVTYIELTDILWGDEEIENPEFVAKEDRTILGTMKYEMACKVIDKAVEWLQIEAADVQIALAENEPDEEEQDKKGE